MVEENGVAVASYVYSKETGNLIQSRDKEGVITFYEYAQPPAGVPAGPQYAKPVRIYQGTRKARKLVATMQYDQAGHVIQQTDAAGKTVRFSYDAKGSSRG